MSSIEQLNDFAEAWVGSNLLDRCVEEVRGPLKRGSEVVSNKFHMVGGLFYESRDRASQCRLRCRLPHDYYYDWWSSSSMDTVDGNSLGALSYY